MNIFNQIVADERRHARRLGFPLYGRDLDLRAEIMGRMNPQGWRTPKKEPVTRPQYKIDGVEVTRGDYRRHLRKICNAKVSEERAPEFMHSHARRRLAAK